MTLQEIELEELLKQAKIAINNYAMDNSLINWQRQLRATKRYNKALTTFNKQQYGKKKRENAHGKF